MIVPVSPEWNASRRCVAEFLLATQLGKRVFPVLIAFTPFSDLPFELTAHFQMADMSRPEIEHDGLNRLPAFRSAARRARSHGLPLATAGASLTARSIAVCAR